MAAIGTGWATAAWVEAGWVSEAWSDEEAATTGGGYTPYMVYDPRLEEKIQAKRRKLRQEREQLHLDLKRLVAGAPLQAQETPRGATGRPADKTAPVAAPAPRRDRAAENKAVLQAAAISARRARLEAIQGELQALDADFQALQDSVNIKARRKARENELITILLLAS